MKESCLLLNEKMAKVSWLYPSDDPDVEPDGSEEDVDT
jgi:hypothetical protein